MPSESTRALGQPSEMNPTFGATVIRLDETSPQGEHRARGVAFSIKMRLLCALWGKISGFFFLVGRLHVAGRLRAAWRSAESRHSGESREREAGENVARLALQLFLHLQEHVSALFHVRRDQALHRRALEAHELLPQVLV